MSLEYIIMSFDTPSTLTTECRTHFVNGPIEFKEHFSAAYSTACLGSYFQCDLLRQDHKIQDLLNGMRTQWEHPSISPLLPSSTHALVSQIAFSLHIKLTLIICASYLGAYLGCIPHRNTPRYDICWRSECTVWTADNLINSKILSGESMSNVLLI